METIPDYIDILSILKFLHEKTVEDGGDGEAVWLTRYYKLKDIVDIIKNSKIETSWDIELKDNYIIWGKNQEYVYITNDSTIYTKFSGVELRLELH